MTPGRPSDVDDRVAREKEFHSEGSRLRDLIDRWNRPGARVLEAALLGQIDNISGMDVLHLGCGAGEIGMTDQLSRRRPRTLISFDIAETRVRAAKERRSGSGELFLVADAHRLPIPTGSIDVVTGLAILHHLDLPLALAEIRRVLRAKGRMVVAEPMAYHPVVAAGRLLTPSARTPDEQPFRRRELDLISRAFGEWKATYIHLLAPVLALPMAAVSRKASEWTVSTVSRVDRGLIDRFPRLGRLCWYVVIDASLDGGEGGANGPAV